MATIRAWLARHPGKAEELMWQNRSFIFFREADVEDARLGPVAAAKVPLEPGRSMAVDKHIHTFGTPFFVSAPDLEDFDAPKPFARLMVAQDTGSAIKGAREIGFAVIAMTITLPAVYTPIGFMEGTTGKLFTEFAWALAGAVLVSGFVALTATPMMSALFLKRQEKHGRMYLAIERVFEAMTSGYRKVLRISLRMRLVVIAVGLAVAGSSYLFITQINSELAPYEDQGTVLGIFLAPQGSTIEYTDKWAAELEKVYASNENIKRYFVVSGYPIVSQGVSFLKLPLWSERTVSQQDVAKQLQPHMFGVPGVLAFPVNPPPLGQGSGPSPMQLLAASVGNCLSASLLFALRKFKQA